MIPDLIRAYRKKKGCQGKLLPYREMADDISRQLGVPDAITYNSINLWEKDHNKPRPTLMHLIFKHCTGDLKELARDILKELEDGQPVQS